ncbi:MAG: hypothetical protein GY844_19400 [Bradyrhizobium sp.]|nr:hypothetical protein [Bradyrhizobium sp.]
MMALLFAFDFFSPKAAADSGIHSADVVDKSTLRIRSEQKWPERVVLDTTQATIVPKAAAPVTQAALPAPDPMAEMTAKARVRETFAQFVPAEPKKDTVARKRKTAKAPSQPVRVARTNFFGPSAW